MKLVDVEKNSKDDFLSSVQDRDTLRVPGLKSLRGGIKLSNILSMLRAKKRMVELARLTIQVATPIKNQQE